MPRNIVLCFDGTGDWAATDTTNVMKLFLRMERDPERQLVYYAGGVGTLGTPTEMSTAKQLYYRALDLATAKTIGAHALDGYTFLVSNWSEGDCIYLLGFSRGAYTARLMASLLHNFGLLQQQHANLAPYLWQTISSFKTIQDFWEEADKIRHDFARVAQAGMVRPDIEKGVRLSWEQDVKIHFMGLFDTVSSVGIFERFKVYPYTDRNPSVLHIRHAVSIDEQRNCFPELLIRPAGNDVSEIWFPGVHRDIGGGADPAGYSNQTLVWMMNAADECGLILLDKTSPKQADKQIHFGWNDPYVFAGLYPMKMFDYSPKDLRTANWGYAAIANKLFHHKPAQDPGFRFFWPNIKHVRRIPENAYVYHDPDTVLKGGEATGIKTARNTKPAQYAKLGPNFADAVGTFLGVILSVLAMNVWLWRPLQWLFDRVGHPDLNGRSWPPAASTFVFWGFFLYLVFQFFSVRPPVPSSKWLTPSLGLLGSVLLVAYTGLWWPALWIAAGFGLVVTCLSQLGSKAILPADRAIAYFMVPWFLIALIAWIVGALWDWSSPWVHIALTWLFEPRQGFSLPFLLRTGAAGSFHPLLRDAAWIAAMFVLVIGIANIWQDRAKLNEESLSSEPETEVTSCSVALEETAQA